MFNYLGEYVRLPWEYVQLPWGVCSTTLRSMFNYPGEYVQLPWEYVQLPWGVCSTTLGSMFDYPGEYVQLPWGVFSTTLGSIFNYRWILGNIVKSKCLARGCLKKVRTTSSENAGEVFARRFFDFFWAASRETPTLESIFGRLWSETGLKSKRFVRGCPTKVNKTSRESAVPSQK